MYMCMNEKLREKAVIQIYLNLQQTVWKIFESPMTVWKNILTEKEHKWVVVQNLHKNEKRAIIWRWAKSIEDNKLT